MSIESLRYDAMTLVQELVPEGSTNQAFYTMSNSEYCEYYCRNLTCFISVPSDYCMTDITEKKQGPLIKGQLNSE